MSTKEQQRASRRERKRNAHAPVRVPGHAQRADGVVGQERPEQVQGEDEVRAGRGDEAVELGCAAAGRRRGQRGERREGRGRRRGCVVFRVQAVESVRARVRV